jgi:hypothetical protein
MIKSEARARILGLPVHSLYAAAVDYLTPSGRSGHVVQYVRAETEDEAISIAIARTITSPRRSVDRGITVNLTAIITSSH